MTRKYIDDYYANKEIDVEYYNSEISKAENRLTNTGFLGGLVDVSKQLYNVRAEIPTKDFLGIVMEYDDEKEEAIVEQRNYFEPGDMLEFFGPEILNKEVKVEYISDLDGNSLDAARHPLQLIKIKVPFKVKKFDMIRRK